MLKISYINENEFEQWINGLYQQADTYFDVELPGNRKMRFSKRFPLGDLEKLSQCKTEFEKNVMLISIMSRIPKLAPEQVKRLPADIITLIMKEIKKNADVSGGIEKKN